MTAAIPRFFRAPYGVRWFGLKSAAVAPVADGRDVDRHRQRLALASAPHLAPALQRASNGAILCLHDGRTTQRAPDIRPTLDAVAYVIPILKERGFQFETVSRIL